MKIRTKINLTFIVGAVICFSVLGFLVEYNSLKDTKRTIYSYLYSSGRARAEHIITFLKEKRITSDILAATSVYRDFLKEPETSLPYKGIKQKVDARLLRTLDADTDIIETFILDKKGKIVSSSDTSQVGKDKSQDEYFLNSKEKVYFKDIYYSSTTKELNFTFSSPVKDNDGTFLGVSVLRYSPKSLYPIIINENGLGETEENFIIRKDLVLLSSVKFLDETKILNTKIDTENARACYDINEVEYIVKNGYSGLKNVSGHTDAVENKDYRGVDVISTHTYLPDTQWCLITKVDKTDALKDEYTLLAYFWIYIVISLIIFILIIILSINKIIKSIFSFVEATKKYINGDKEYRIKIESKDEVGELGQSFNKMADVVAESRAEIDKKVSDQTGDIINKSKELEKQRSAVLNILEDIKEEKVKAEGLASIVENSDQAILGKDLNGKITSWNKGAEKLYGYKAEEMINKPVDIIVPKDKIDELNQLIKRIISGDRIEHYLTQRLKKDGSIVDVSLSLSPIINLNGTIVGISAMAIDITKERQVDKAKSEFVSLASHQLRTPLSTINWYAEMILDGDVGHITEDQKKYLDEIYSANKRMVELVNSLLNVSKIDLGTFTVEPEPVDLKDVVKNVLSELQEKISKKNIKIKEDLEALPKINLDPKLIHIVFQNLISNAVKYTHDEGIVEISIKTHTDKVVGFTSDKGIMITVKDNGLGIPAKDKDKMFTKLFRADNATEYESEGTGLGLYIVRSIIEGANGKIWFESEENRGTTFFALIPFEGMKKKVGAKPLV